MFMNEFFYLYMCVYVCEHTFLPVVQGFKRIDFQDASLSLVRRRPFRNREHLGSQVLSPVPVSFGQPLRARAAI